MRRTASARRGLGVMLERNRREIVRIQREICYALIEMRGPLTARG